MNDIMLISGGTLIDGTGSDPKPNEGILIEGTRILSVGKQAVVMAKDRSDENSYARFDRLPSSLFI